MSHSVSCVVSPPVIQILSIIPVPFMVNLQFKRKSRNYQYLGKCCQEETKDVYCLSPYAQAQPCLKTLPLSNGHHIVAILKLNGYVRPVLCYDKYKFSSWSLLCEAQTVAHTLHNAQIV